jgi:glycosyltransferase involved in cell wall biosynthesis
LNLQPDELVSVIIPAYNAQLTLDETLRSVRAQTHRDLEILVIDDGSTDGTVDLALRHAAEDGRVRVLRQANGGVAAARNYGLAQARGRFLAPVDADDLWRPAKIERQLAAVRAAGDDVGLVYTWFTLIDEQSRAISNQDGPVDEGCVLARMCRGNLVGNGSSPLMLRDAVLGAGGYDERLRREKAQGCEDLKLYLQIAERYTFACVREGLTGYRVTRSNMSSDSRQMLASYDLVMGEFRQRHPDYAGQIHEGRVSMIRWLLMRALRGGNWPGAGRMLDALFQHDLGAAALCLTRIPLNLARFHAHDLARKLDPGGRFGGGPFLAAGGRP